MFQSLEIFQTATDMARHAGARQAVVARNIANADTPGFQAQTIPAFKDVYQVADPARMRQTRPGHVMGSGPTVAKIAPADAGNPPSPNGNTVSLEDELLNAVAVSREHNRALTIYRHTMTVLRNGLGRT